MEILGGHHKIGLYLGVISMHLRVFSSGHCTEWGYFFGVAKIFKYFLGCLKFLIFFGVKGRCWVRAYVCRKIESKPPGVDATVFKFSFLSPFI